MDSFVVGPDGVDGLVYGAGSFLVLVPVKVRFSEAKEAGVDLGVDRVEDGGNVVSGDGETVDILIEYADGV